MLVIGAGQLDCMCGYAVRVLNRKGVGVVANVEGNLGKVAIKPPSVPYAPGTAQPQPPPGIHDG